MKRAFFLSLFLILIMNTVVFSYELPSRFWNINSSYESAVHSNNSRDVIKYGNEIINLMMNEPDTDDKKDILISRYKEVGLAYANLDDYVMSANAFRALYSLAQGYGSEFEEEMKTARSRLLQYEDEFIVYTDKGTAPYYHATNEKSNGVLYGICANGESLSKLSNRSMVLTYQELGQNLIAYNRGVMQKAHEQGIAVEFALNCPNEALDIENFKNIKGSLSEISELFDRYDDVPVYLRFAAEFDVWTDIAVSDEYKEAFRYVSKFFRDRNSNVAIVWNPNQVSNWHVNIDDYYPGDDYVDWVGISSYAQKYFLGDKNQSEANEVAFKTGLNSNPVIAIKDIVEKYGDRKPIMISESGCGHKLVKSGENTEAFALERLKEYYSYLPMVYPQIKLIAYFDWYVNSDSENDDFRLSTNSALQNEYIKRTKGARFIQCDYDNSSDMCYRRIYDGIGVDGVFELSAYAHKYDNKTSSVSYFIDNEYVGVSYDIPFSMHINANNYSGKHELKAIAAFADGSTLTKEFDIIIGSSPPPITVEISGEEIGFDTEPVIYNDRTLVPMRTIFEELGANVTWNDSTKTVLAQRGDRQVEVSVGGTIMLLNGKRITLDTPPIIISGRTLVPARAVAEGMGCDVEWDNRTYTVFIEPKVFSWSDWKEDIPNGIDENMYYIEEKTEYRYSVREEYSLFEPDNSKTPVRTDVDYSNWSDWQDSPLYESDKVEVETRTVSNTKQYHYAHYCTGRINDVDNRYKTSSSFWHEECTYHDLGWFDYELRFSEDSTNDYVYFVDGEKYRCSNSCFRWYLIETSGGDYTQYRSRTKSFTYTYRIWTDWSDWDEEDPDDYVDGVIKTEDRRLYRYKEK